MLKEKYNKESNKTFNKVLILILMEHAQRDVLLLQRYMKLVLILILMEHAQRGVRTNFTKI